MPAGDSTWGGVCPLCGGEYDEQLPDHLVDECPTEWARVDAEDL